MAIEKVEGIVISETLFGESSKILKVFTKEYGLISLMAKGCRKPKSAFREASNKLIYSNFDIRYKESGISTLLGVSVINIFKNITMDYKDFNKKIYAFSLTDLTVQVLNQKQLRKNEIEKIYDIFIAALKKIDEGFSPLLIFDIVKFKYLEYLGVKPSIDCCSNCGSNIDIVTIASRTYGYICKNCYNNEKIVSNETLKIFRMLYYVDINKIKKLDLKDTEISEINEFLDDYYEEHTGLYFKIDDKFKMMRKFENNL